MSGNPINRRRAIMAGVAGLAGAATIPLAANLATAESTGGPSPNATKVYIDPGHGGSDGGAPGNGLLEKDLTLDISLRTRDLLTSAGHTVRMSRDTDIFRELSWRASDANSWGAALFVSIHINAGGGTGFESYRYTSVGQPTVDFHNRLHAGIIGGMNSHSPVTDRGLKTANFAVLRLTSMPAVLTENLFIDRAEDAALLKDSSFLQATAEGHANRIEAMLASM